MTNSETEKKIEALKIEAASSESSVRINAFVNLGLLFKSSSDMISAQNFFNKALDEGNSLNEIKKGEIHHNLALIQFEELNYDRALEHAQRALQCFVQANDVSNQIEQYKLIIKVYTRKKDKQNALVSINKKFSLMNEITDKEYEIARVYHSLRDYDNALKHFKRVRIDEADTKRKTDVYNFIGRNYLKKNKPDQAYKYLLFAFENRQSLDKLGYIYTYENLGVYYHLKEQLEKARPYYDDALKLLVEYNDLSYMFYFFDEVNRVNSTFAYELASKHSLGIIWISENSAKSHPIFKIKNWNNLINASSNWWDYILNAKNSSNSGQWKISQMIQDLSSKVTSQSVLNFIMGANDIDMTILYDEEESLKPLWFIEFPPTVNHGDKYLKFRLNNLVQRKSVIYGYPQITSDGKTNFVPIERIIVKIRTQWLQEFTIDQIFTPNTQEEWETFIKAPQKTWLKNVYKIDLGTNSKSKDAIELTSQIEIYFKSSNETPDVKCSNITHFIPIRRKNRLQKIEKYKINNENALTLLIALSSILSSIYIFISNSKLIDILLNQDLVLNHWLTIVIIVLFFIMILLSGFYVFFIRETNTGESKSKIQT